VGYQPEERYWTDYLRIALPVVGLLLMLGLFWFWAASLIGDEDDDSPGNVAANTPVPTATSPAAVAGPTQVPGEVTGGTDAELTATTPPEGTDATARDDANPADPGTDETEPAVGNGTEDESAEGDPAACELDFCPDDSVTVNSEVNFRPNPNTDEEPIRLLITGEELIVLDEDQVEDEEFVWIPVEDADGESGWVVSEFLDPAA